MTTDAASAPTPRQLYGTDDPLPEERLLRAGPLTALFSGGALRSIKVRGVEVIRSLAFLARDRNWGTVPCVLSNVAVEEDAGRFTVRFEAEGTSAEGGLRWSGSIEGSPKDGLSFRVEGRGV